MPRKKRVGPATRRAFKVTSGPAAEREARQRVRVAIAHRKHQCDRDECTDDDTDWLDTHYTQLVEKALQQGRDSLKTALTIQ